MKTLNELIENAFSIVKQVEPKRHLFPDFYKKAHDHLIHLLNLKKGK